MAFVFLKPVNFERKTMKNKRSEELENMRETIHTRTTNEKARKAIMQCLKKAVYHCSASSNGDIKKIKEVLMKLIGEVADLNPKKTLNQ